MLEPELVLTAIGRLMAIEWKALEDQMCVSYNYVGVKIMVLLTELPFVRRSASGAEVREGEQPDRKHKY